jgi:hypothetical protein
VPTEFDCTPFNIFVYVRRRRRGVLGPSYRVSRKNRISKRDGSRASSRSGLTNELGDDYSESIYNAIVGSSCVNCIPAAR